MPSSAPSARRVEGETPRVDTVTGAALTGTTLAASQRVQAGLKDVLHTGNLRSKPTVIVSGRSDALVPVNHASRAYAAFNTKVEGANSKLRYYEIENGNHFVPSCPIWPVAG